MPIDETASPIFLAPVAKNAAMLSVVPAITVVFFLKPKSISSEFLNSVSYTHLTLPTKRIV